MRESGTADRPTAVYAVAQDPYHWYNGPESLAPVDAPDPAPPDSWTQGEGKSPGFRWPWQRFFQSRQPNVAYHSGASHKYRHELPSRILIAGERGPLDRHYLDFYEQAPRHAWPGGGVIEYQPSVPVVAIARRIGEPMPTGGVM